MGSSGRTSEEIRRNDEKYQRQARDIAKKERMALANKIVMVIVDQISANIIRPGPTPEERECYVMAQELRDSAESLRLLVAEVIRIDQKEG